MHRKCYPSQMDTLLTRQLLVPGHCIPKVYTKTYRLMAKRKRSTREFVLRNFTQ